MLREDLKVAEIDYRDGAGRVFDFHALRHQYITTLAKAHPTSVAQRLARHSTSKLTDRYTHVLVHDVVGAVDSLPEPINVPGTTLRATGTESACGCGDARVTGQLSSTGQNRHESIDRPKKNLREKKTANMLPLKKLSEAEGMGLEPTTPCGALHFQCSRWPIRLPSEVSLDVLS
jgi:hypothetical protein